jgi:hypothetical protein
MAITAAGTALSARHRLQQVALRAALLRDLLRLWPAFDPTDFGTWDRFARAAVVLITARHRDSAGLAVQYLEDYRRAEGAAGSFAPVLAEPPATARSQEALRATGLMGILNARRAGLSVVDSARNGFVRVSGSASRLVLEGGRQTVMATLHADPARPRWQRITGGQPCDFCRMLAGRGAVYGAQTGDFQAHDHCSCMAEPAFAEAA